MRLKKWQRLIRGWNNEQFLVGKSEKPTCIHECLLKVYREATVDVSSLVFHNRYDRLKKMKKEGQNFMTNQRVVTIAPN